ncbi:MAG: hypothetical protein ACRDYA_10165 [Egibacteraceae bacterium]
MASMPRTVYDTLVEVPETTLAVGIDRTEGQHRDGLDVPSAAWRSHRWRLAAQLDLGHIPSPLKCIECIVAETLATSSREFVTVALCSLFNTELLMHKSTTEVTDALPPDL